jgi:hypothetical protein
MDVWTNVERSRSRLVHRLHDWWLAAREASGVPDRHSLNPADFVSMLPNLVIAEVERNPFRIRYRLVGTRVTEFTGFDFTGRYLDELIALGSTNQWLDSYASACEGRHPVYGSVTEPTTSGGTFTFEFALFPISLGSDRVDQFVAVEDYFGATFISAQLRPLV